MTTKIDLLLQAADVIRETIKEQAARLKMPTQPFQMWNGRGGVVLMTSEQCLAQLAFEPKVAMFLRDKVPDELEEAFRDPLTQPPKPTSRIGREQVRAEKRDQKAKRRAEKATEPKPGAAAS